MNVLLFVVVVISWGFSWFAIKLQVGTVPVEASIAWRFFAASSLLFFVLATTKRLVPVPARTHSWLALFGLLLFCLNFVLVYSATSFIPSGMVSVVFATASIFTAMNSWLFLGRPPSMGVILGSLCGIAGLALLFAEDLAGWRSSDAVFGLLLTLGGTYSFSLGSVVAIAVKKRIDLSTGTAWAMLYGAVFATAISLLRHNSIPIGTSRDYLLGFLYVTVVASFIGTLTYNQLLLRLGPARAAYATVLFPIVALATSTAFEGFVWTASRGLGTALTLAGMALVFGQNRTPKRPNDW